MNNLFKKKKIYKYKKFLLYFFSILFLSVCNSNADTETFSYTGTQQTWTVPNGVTSITVDAYGAGGGNSSGNSGGNGARVQTTLTVTPGDVLYIYVGETGTDAANGVTLATSFNGGGKGGASNIGTRSGASGGGQTDIRTSSNTSDIIMVAGGGGGASAAGDGGSGGQTGSDGVGSSKGLGASQSAGGTKGTGNTGRDSSDGSAFTGGTGGRTANFRNQYGGGAGGAGYYGGGGGGAGTSGSASGSGGGGSSYVSSTLGSLTTFTTGYSSASGNGSLEIEYTAIIINPTTNKDVVGSVDVQSELVKNLIIQSTSIVSNRLSYLRQNRENTNLSKNNIKLDFEDAILTSLTNELLAKNDKSIIPDNWSSWSEGSISVSKIGDRNGSSSKETHGQALAFGLDRKLDNNNLWGFAIQYGQSDTDVGTNGTNVDSENINLSIYQTLPLDNNNFIEGLYGVGLIESDLLRKSGANTLTGSRNGTQIFGSINFGKTIDKGDFNLTPITRVDLGYTELDAYSETGTDALSYGKQTIESGLASVGLQFSDIVKFNETRLKPFGSIEYGMDFSNSSEAKMNYVSDTSTIYTYNQGANSNHLITSIIGFEYITKNNLEIISSYKRIQGNESEQTDILNLNINFKSEQETEYAMTINGSEDLKAGFDISKNVNGFDLKFNANQSLSENSDQTANVSLSRSF